MFSKDLVNSLHKIFVNWKAWLLISLLNMLVVPAFFTYGYIASNASKKFHKEDKFTKFKDWKRYGKIGFVFLLLSIIAYIPIALVLTLVGLPWTRFLFYSPEYSGIQMILPWLTGIIMAYLVMAIIVNYVNNPTTKGLFNFKRIKKLMTSKEYLKRYAVAVIIFIALLFVESAILKFVTSFYGEGSFVILPLTVSYPLFFIRNLIQTFGFTFYLNFLGGAYK